MHRAFLLAGCLWSGKHRKALAVWRQVQVPCVRRRVRGSACWTRGAVCQRRTNRPSRCRLPPLSGCPDSGKTVPGRYATRWVRAAASGDLPLAGPRGRPRERPYIHFVASRFVGRISHPPADRREGRLLATTYEGTAPACRAWGAPDRSRPRQRPEIECCIHAYTAVEDARRWPSGETE